MRRIFRAIVVAALSAAGVGGATPGAAPASNVLVSYSFDDSLTDTGPDTFAVFQNARGHVRLVEQIRYSGYRSIELRDVAHDGDFPELQGYFPERKTGELFFHFAMLVANPEETLNVALAGPSHFTTTKDGIALWLKSREGFLIHISDSIPKRLFRIEPFVWYIADIRYDIPHGRYDLTIRKEGPGKPLVALTDQPNATNTPASSVDKFSFVGEVYEDDSNVTYYVDDVVIGTDEKIALPGFVAPGRRKLFIDRWREAHVLMAKKPSCPPVMSVADFGLSVRDIEAFQNAREQWRATCAAMENDPPAAAQAFAELSRLHPGATIYAMSELMALTRAGDGDQMMKRWTELEPLLHDDPRYGMIAAVADLDRTERWMEGRLPADDPDIAQQYYFVLLWKNDFMRAARFAEKRSWPERAGDALFLAGSPAEARTFYEEALRRDPNAWGANTRLSDIFFLLGDADNERRFREKMYGRLRR
jgi:hypothetical protein